MIPLTAFFTVDIFLGMTALRVVNIPMFTILRRLTILVVLLLEYIVLKKVPSKAVKVSILITVIGRMVF